MSTGHRILLISPVFHDYWRSLADAFEADGHTVVPHCYDVHDSFTGKLWNKIAYEGLDRLRPDMGTKRFAHVVTERARATLRAVRPDVVVIVKGDLFESGFWDDLDDAGVPRLLWLWDELRRTRHSLESLRRFPSVASYSPLDVETLRETGINAHLLPNAFDPARVGPPVPSDDVVFIGARYPKRERLLVDLVDLGVPVRAIGRDWSTRPVDRLRTWSWARPPVPSDADVPLPEACGIMAGAIAALNIHGDQDGFTMRTFEAAGAGGLQLIDRDDVGRFFEPEFEVITFESAEEAAELAGRAQADRAWARSIAAAAKARALSEHTFLHRTRLMAEQWR